MKEAFAVGVRTMGSWTLPELSLGLGDRNCRAMQITSGKTIEVAWNVWSV
jgi:hypothetical protein